MKRRVWLQAVLGVALALVSFAPTPAPARDLENDETGMVAVDPGTLIANILLNYAGGPNNVNGIRIRYHAPSNTYNVTIYPTGKPSLNVGIPTTIDAEEWWNNFADFTGAVLWLDF